MNKLIYNPITKSFSNGIPQVIKVNGISLTIPDSKIRGFEKTFLDKIKIALAKGDQFTLNTDDVNKYAVQVKFDKNADLERFRNIRSLDFSYYIEGGKRSPYCLVTNTKTLMTEDNTTKVLIEDLPKDANFWKVLDGYGIDAYNFSHWTVGRGTAVNIQDLAKALITDYSITKALVTLNEKNSNRLQASIEKSVDSFMEKHKDHLDLVLKYINENY